MTLAFENPDTVGPSPENPGPENVRGEARNSESVRQLQGNAGGTSSTGGACIRRVPPQNARRSNLSCPTEATRY